MASKISQSADLPVDDIKLVPADAETREAIRSVAAEVAVIFDRSHPPLREDLERCGQSVLARLDLSRRFLGFAMVAVSNAFWRPVMEAIPFHRRLFLLPHCLSDRAACAGSYDSVGLHCAGCGSCEIHALKTQAEQLGYSVIVAEGTSSLFLEILEGDVDAILGVACLDSLEKSFQHLVDLGVAHMAVPLLKDGCRNTEAEIDQIRILLTAQAAPSLAAPRSYVPLLRETTRMFQPPLFGELLAPYLESAELANHQEEDSPSVEGIAWNGSAKAANVCARSLRLPPMLSPGTAWSLSMADRKSTSEFHCRFGGWPWPSRLCTRLRWYTTTSRMTTSSATAGPRFTASTAWPRRSTWATT